MDQLSTNTNPGVNQANSKISSNFKSLSYNAPLLVVKNTYVDEFLGKILDASSYLQNMYLFVYADKFQFANYGRYYLTDRGTGSIKKRRCVRWRRWW